jgi:hypothetical protein
VCVIRNEEENEEDRLYNPKSRSPRDTQQDPDRKEEDTSTIKSAK